MIIDRKFVIWCVKKCLYLWKAPPMVLNWLDDPLDIDKAILALAAANKDVAVLWEKQGTHPIYYEAAWAAECTAWGAHAIAVPFSSHTISQSIMNASIALNIEIADLKHEFTSTWTDEELNTTDPEWIEYATVEMMNRETR